MAKKLCPHLNFVKPHFDQYMEWSAKVFAVARRYDPNLAKAGCDEGYLVSQRPSLSALDQV